jgi:hypothetical protein
MEPAPTTQADDYGLRYEILSGGGGLYVGTVTKVADKEVKYIPSSGLPQLYRSGTIRFRVERTLLSERVPELVAPYTCQCADRPCEALGADWVCFVWDNYPPKVGLHLMLQVLSKTDGAKEVHNPEVESAVAGIWSIGRADPYVDACAEACRYLSSDDDGERARLFARLCQSDFESIRLFAQDAAFEPTNPPLAKSIRSRKLANNMTRARLIVSFLKLAGPKLSSADEWERTSVTDRLGPMLAYAFVTTRAPAGLREAFESWYLAELATPTDSVRCRRAVFGLCGLVQERGAAGTLELFERPPTLLLERLQDCTASPDPLVSEESKELLKRLRQVGPAGQPSFQDLMAVIQKGMNPAGRWRAAQELEAYCPFDEQQSAAVKAAKDWAGEKTLGELLGKVLEKSERLRHEASKPEE